MGARGENDCILVQMNLEKNLRKEIQKKIENGTGAAGPTPPPFRPSERPGLPPPPLSPARAAPALSQAASATWRPYAGDGRAAAGHLHPPLVGTPARAPRPLHPFCRAPLSLLPPPSAHAAQQQQFRRAPLPEKAPPLAADRTRASSSPPRAPAPSSSLG